MNARSILVALSVCASLSLIGCRTLGLDAGKSAVLEKKLTSKVMRICLLPIVSTTDYSGTGRVLDKPEYRPMSDDSVTMEVWQKIVARRVVQLVPMDSVRKAIRQLGWLSPASVPFLARMLSVDAVLTGLVRYYWYDPTDIPAATMTLVLRSPASDTSLVYSTYDSGKGSGIIPLSSQSMHEARMIAVRKAVGALMDEIVAARTP